MLICSIYLKLLSIAGNTLALPPTTQDDPYLQKKKKRNKGLEQQ